VQCEEALGSVLQCVAVRVRYNLHFFSWERLCGGVVQCEAVCCSVLQ